MAFDGKFLKTPQQMIAELQLEKLLKVAIERDLTLEEVKMYDLLCKNLNLSEGKASEILEAQYRLVEEERKNLPEHILVKKALSTDKSDDET